MDAIHHNLTFTVFPHLRCSTSLLSLTIIFVILRNTQACVYCMPACFLPALLKLLLKSKTGSTDPRSDLMTWQEILFQTVSQFYPAYLIVT